MPSTHPPPLVASATGHRPEARHGWLVPGILSVGLLATALLTWSSVSEEQRNHHRRERPVADRVVTALRSELLSTGALVQDLAELQPASRSLTGAELQRFADQLMLRGQAFDAIGAVGVAETGPAGERIRSIALPPPGDGGGLPGRSLWSLSADGSPPPPGIAPAAVPPEGLLRPGRAAPGSPPFLLQAQPVLTGDPLAPSAPVRGWAFATLPLRPLLRTALSSPLLAMPEPLDLQLYSGERADPQRLLYDSRNLHQPGVLPHPESRRLELGGQRWLLLVQIPVQDAKPHHVPHGLPVLLLGLGATTGLTLLGRRQRRLQRHAGRQSLRLARLGAERRDATGRQRLLEEALRLIQEGVLITDASGAIQACNDAYLAITGYRLDELLGRNPRMMQSSYQASEFYQALWEELLRTGCWQGEIWNRRRSGEIYPAWLRMGTVHGASGETSHFVAVMTDLSHLRAKDRQLEHLGYHDRLTNLPNLQMAELRLGQLCQRQRPLVVIWIGIDGVKRIEDSLGAAIGDRLLQEVVVRLEAFIGPGDILARVGSSEFLLVRQPGIGDAQGLAIARRIVAGLHESMHKAAGMDLSLTAWAGLSSFPEHARDPESLLQCASLALGQARELGALAIVSYSEEMATSSRRRLAIEAQLRRAVLEGTLEVHFQPQVDGEGRLLGAEALVRWSHPEFGPIGPQEFLPIAEATELIHPLGSWVLETACRHWQDWLGRGLEPGLLAVNLSTRQFQNPAESVPRMVRAALSRTGLPPERLELEITESCLMPALGTREQITELESLGVELAIDDFGTGYSSLSTLHSHPIHKLKIDRSFVHRVDSNPTAQSIVRATLAMAAGLGMTTLAEGVESPAELAVLRQWGCQAFQGYLFSRPLPPDAFAQLLERKRSGGRVGGLDPAVAPRP